ncbi:hypothetical protein [Pseudofrankia sp. DC12]|uniref:hypothetical protein n=1 Tax=Pseudofrankia sp. DC12 TaxID=683315 RepID=UPI0018DEADFA|nr:hypothetical protein [Pseudofrankia sp. DC12]
MLAMVVLLPADEPLPELDDPLDPQAARPTAATAATAAVAVADLSNFRFIFSP